MANYGQFGAELFKSLCDGDLPCINPIKLPHFSMSPPQEIKDAVSQVQNITISVFDTVDKSLAGANASIANTLDAADNAVIRAGEALNPVTGKLPSIDDLTDELDCQ